MGPESAKSFPGKELLAFPTSNQTHPAGSREPQVCAEPAPATEDCGPATVRSCQEPEANAEPAPATEGHGPPAPRAKQEADYGRRGKGYIFGAFQPATGDAFTAPYTSRSAANFADFLGKVDEWVPEDVERIYAILDNLSAHRATDILLFSLGHERWEFVFQPKYAPYLNLIEPWWKALRSLALKGRRFETWEQLCEAIAEATNYWNKHRHPFVWGHRRRHRAKRRPGTARTPNVR